MYKKLYVIQVSNYNSTVVIPREITTNKNLANRIKSNLENKHPQKSFNVYKVPLVNEVL